MGKKKRDVDFNWLFDLPKKMVEEFYPDHILADFTFSSEQDPLVRLIAKAKKAEEEQVWTQKQLEEKCFQIRSNLVEGKGTNIEVRFDKLVQQSYKSMLDLGTTICKIRIYGKDEADYFYMRNSESLNVRVFLGENTWGILVILDEDGNEYFIRLEEFYLLSMPEEEESPKPIITKQDVYERMRNEIGLMTSFHVLSGIFTSCIMGTYLFPIKSLLLSEYLKSEWQRVKDSIAKQTSEGEKNV